MQLGAKKTTFAAAVLIVIAVATSMWLARSKMPPFNFPPVPKNAPTLNQADIEKILGVEQLHLIRSTRRIPACVKQSFTNFTGFSFDMADPGDPISSDAIVPGRPTRRLAFAAISDESAIVVYEQGGYVGTFNVVVFWYGEGGRDWGATLGSPVSSVSALRTAIRKGDFRAWKGIDVV